MAYIDSSVGSPLEGIDGDADEDDALVEDEPVAPILPRPQRKRGQSTKDLLTEWSEDLNLARRMQPDELDSIGAEVIEEFRIDERSRSEWADSARTAMKFALQETEKKTSPWVGASNIIFPLIGKAAMDFNARTLPAMIQGRNVVRGAVWGDDRGTPITDTGKADGKPKMIPPAAPGQQPQVAWLIKPGEKRERADRVGEHMSWQLLEEMREWKPETDQLLMQIPVIGGAVKKSYWDPIEKRNRSPFVSLINMVWDYRASSFHTAPRHSERIPVYPHEIAERERAEKDESGQGVWLELPYADADTQTQEGSDVRDDNNRHDTNDPSAPHIFIEQHRRLDLDGDGYPEPYIVTVHERSAKVVSIIARYSKEGIQEDKAGDIFRIEPDDVYTLIPFLPNIDGGSYPMGFGHLLRNLNDGINTTLNQMFDAGTLANTGAMVAGSDVTFPSGEIGFQVGRAIRAKTKPGQKLTDNLMLLPFPGPNMVLFQLLGLLIQSGKEIASIQDILTGDADIANAPPTTVLALIEQGMKLNNAIHTRVFWGFGEEYMKLFKLNKKHLKEATEYKIGDKWSTVTPEDYALSGGVEPVADPTMTTDMQKLGRAQLIKEICWGNMLFNQNEVATRILEAGNVERIQDLFAPPDPNQQAMAQLAMAKAQAELGRERAAEQKDLAAAFFSMAQARKLATAGQETAIEAQLEWFRLRIEALNTTVKAAAVDHDFHKTNLEHTRALAEAAAENGTIPDSATPPAVTPTPGPTGPFPSVPNGPPAPAGGGLAPPHPAPPDNSGLEPLPGPGAQPLAGAPGVAGPTTPPVPQPPRGQP